MRAVLDTTRGVRYRTVRVRFRTAPFGNARAHGRTITLGNLSGGSVSLKHRGDTLYGMAHDRNGYMVAISVEKDSGALASPPSIQSGREGKELGVEPQAP